MFANYQQARTSVQQPPIKSGRGNALAAYEQGIATNDERANPFALQSKGIGAGSGVNMYRKGVLNQRGLAQARGGAQNAYMDAIEQNRKAQLAAEDTRAKELASVIGTQQDMEQADAIEKLNAAAIGQTVELDSRRRAAQNTARYAGVLGGLINSVLSDRNQSQGGVGGLLSSLL